MYRYIPILRPRRTERHLMEQFAIGFEEFDASQEPDEKLLPLIELTEPGVDLVNLETVRRELLVDFPRYLSHRSTAFEDEEDPDLIDLLEQYNRDNVQFFTEKQDDIDVPVLSANQPEPIIYHGILSSYRTLRESFGTIAVRPFISSQALDETQQENLATLISELRESDIVLIDILDVAKLDSGLYETIEWILNQVQEQEVYILNAFEPRGGFAHNLGPYLASHLEIAGFGDFATDARYPSGGASSDAERDSILRQYDQDTLDVGEYRAETYPKALNQAQADDIFDSAHCYFCSQMANEDRDWSEIWKRLTMGHYITENIDSTLSEMDEMNPEDLDEFGHDFVQNATDNSDEDQT